MTGLRSGELAAAAGVSIPTLRYYERRGLLPAPGRSPGGHRVYPPSAVDRLRAVKAAQRLGFTLAEAGALLGRGARTTGSDARTTGIGPRTTGFGDRTARFGDRARAKLAEVEARIADLQSTAETLRVAVEAGCDDLASCAAEPRCPIPFARYGASSP